MLYFANPDYLWLLLLVPLLPLLFAFALWLRRRRVRKLGDAASVARLMPHYSPAKAWIRLILADLAVMSLTLALARPQIGAKLAERETKGAEIMICLDVSNSMLAED